MGSATVEISGPDASRWAAQLRAALVVGAGPGESVSPVEVARSADLVIAVIGLVFSGVGTAKTLWDWWHPHRPEGVQVAVLFTDGTRIEVSHLDDRQQLEIVFEQTESSS